MTLPMANDFCGMVAYLPSILVPILEPTGQSCQRATAALSNTDNLRRLA
jgi:hypothetical protein